jgi:sec-independent protein translocase protein TatB
LPEIGRQIGKGLAEFKRASREFQSQIEDEVRKLEVEVDLHNTNTIAPAPVTNTVASKPPALIAGSISEADQPPVISASTVEVVSVSHPDYIDAHPSSKADSVGNA